MSFRASFEAFLGRLRSRIKSPTPLLHFGNGVALLSTIACSDIIEYRSCLVSANICGIAFNLLQSPPLYAPALWGCFFVFGHSFQISRLLLAKSGVVLSEDDHHLYENAFMKFKFSPRQFKELLEAAPPERVSFKANEALVRQGEELTHLHYVMKGSVAVEEDGLELSVCTASRNSWCGEFWGGPACREDDKLAAGAAEGEVGPKSKVTYKALEAVEAVKFSKKALHDHLKRHPEIESAADALEISDLQEKLESTQNNHTVTLYNSLIALSTLDGKISKAAKKMCDAHREAHRLIDERCHRKALSLVGWSVEDYERGWKR